MNARKLSLLVACFGAALGISACDRDTVSSASPAPQTLTPISQTYVVESSEVTEISQFEDGSVKYTPTGWIVGSPSTGASATAAAARQ